MDHRHWTVFKIDKVYIDRPRTLNSFDIDKVYIDGPRTLNSFDIDKVYIDGPQTLNSFNINKVHIDGKETLNSFGHKLSIYRWTTDTEQFWTWIKYTYMNHRHWTVLTNMKYT